MLQQESKVLPPAFLILGKRVLIIFVTEGSTKSAKDYANIHLRIEAPLH